MAEAMTTPETIPTTGAPTAPAGPDWQTLVSGLPPELQSAETIKNLPDFSTAMKSLVDAQQYAVGAIKVPKAEAPPEEWAAYHKKLGVPDKPDGYDLSKLKIPEGVELNEGLKTGFLGIAHKTGLTPSQVNQILEWHGNSMAQQVRANGEAQRQTANDARAHLEAKHGAGAPRLIGQALRAASYYADTDTAAVLKGEGGEDAFLQMFGTPWVLNLMTDLGQRMTEDRLIVDSGEGDAQVASAQAAWQVIQSDPKHAYWDQNNPGHDAAVKQAQSYFELMSVGTRQ